uniref:Thioredoxin-2-like n=1 Tax=Diabrotica virgifera virgifera TaxID=50390 RepID=A0A6P7F9E9_DIAVI
MFTSSLTYKNRLKEAGDSLVILEFIASWCGPCKMIGPKVEQLAKRFQDILFFRIDVDEFEDISLQCEVTSMPTFVFMQNNETLETLIGANSKKLLQAVNTYYSLSD